MRTQALLDKLATEITAHCGDVVAAGKACGVSVKFIAQWRKDDAEVEAVLKEAENFGTQGLVSAAIKRAVQGVEEPVFHRGEVVGHVTKYSDTLLTTLLKAKVNEFKADAASTPQVTVNIANLMPRAETYEQWLQMRDKTNEPKVIAAPVDDNVINVDFKVVDTVFSGIDL